MTDMRLFGEISKVEDQDDGTITVYGIASTGARDDAGEIVLPDAMRAALPDYMKFGAIREMHQPSAAGTALTAEVDEEGRTLLSAHIVDPLAVQKVKLGVYKGFSIGGKVLARDPNDRTIITAIKLIENSLVDRPCQPEAVINLWKADIASGQEQEPMSDTPSNADVIAKAKELAEAAGKPGKHTDFVVKAREALLAKAGESEAEPEPEAPAAEVEPVEGDEDAAAKAADPAVALAAAIEKVMAEPDADAAPGVDFKKLAPALLALATTADGSALYKGLYTVSWLAELMNCFADLQGCMSMEAEWENDGSTLPQKAAEIVAQIAALLVQAAQEEAAEAVEAMNASGVEVVIEAVPEVMEMAAELVDLVKADVGLMEKAGKRNSKADQTRIQESHDHMAKLGAVCDKENCAKDDDVAMAAAAADLAKAQALEARNGVLEDVVAKALPAIEKLTAEVELLKAQPMPPKTAGSALALRVVSKAEDASPGEDAGASSGVAPTEDAVAKYLAGLSDADRGHLLMKAAHARPIAITR